MAGFDFKGARAAGYSDEEIVQHLASDPNGAFDVKGALDAGYSPSEIVTHLSGGEVKPEKSTGYVDALKQGASNVLGGVGQTLDEYVGKGTGETLENAARDIAPSNYEPAKVVGEGGSLTNLPRAVIEASPGMAASIATARAVPGPAWAKLLAGSGAYMLQTLGSRAKQRAVNNTGDQNAEPTASDKIAAVASEVPEAAIGAYGLSRFLPGSGRVTSVGARGVLDAAKELGKTVLAEGATTGAQNTVAQLGATLGTKAGAKVDPTDVLNAAIIGGTTGGVLATPRAAVEAAGAIKYRNFGGGNAPASSSVANDIVRNAQGVDKLRPTLFNSRGKEGFDAVSRTDAENNIALKQQVADLKQTTPLTPEAQGAFDLATAGKALNSRDLHVIDTAVSGAPNGDLVSFLARKASVIAQLKDKGIYNTSKGTFTGGVSNRMTHVLNAQNLTKTALATALGEGAGVHMIAYSPEALAAAATAYSGGRVLDRLSGNLSPASRFAERFVDPTVQPPMTNQPNSAPVGNAAIGPWGPRPQSPVVPQVTPSPNGALKSPPPGFASLLQTAVKTQNKASRQRLNTLKAQAMPLIVKLAAKEALKHGAAMAGEALAGPIGGHIAHGVASILTDLHERGDVGPTEAVPPQLYAQQPTVAKVSSGPLGPGGVPVSVLTRTKALARGLQSVEKLKQTQLGKDYADIVAEKSPLLAKIGGPGVVANPAAGKRMAEMVSAASAYNKLMTGANSVIDSDNTRRGTLKETPHTGGADQQWPPKEITDLVATPPEYAVPSSPYAHLPPNEAANQIAKDAERAGNVKYINGFRSATMRNIIAIRNAAAGVGREVPGINTAELAKQFEGVASRKQAIVHREWLKAKYPEATEALNVYFSDDVINRIWKRKG